jgi:dihydroorotate dehydrogenase electron transfer subunit
MIPMHAEITQIVNETPSTRTFFFDFSVEHISGQYVMVWVRGVDEIPMSLSYPNAITVQKIGEATSALFKMVNGDSFGIRGPFGNGFSLEGRSILLVVGGVGAAPLGSLAERARSDGVRVETILGAKRAEEIFFEKRFKEAGDLLITTDDGSRGRQGLATDLVGEMDLTKYDAIYSCGPEEMMFSVLKMVEGVGMSSRAQFSLQRYVKCGLGICGTCCIDPSGLRICRDGPVFRGDKLIETEFGQYMRDASGKRVKL